MNTLSNPTAGCVITYGKEQLHLLPQRAIWWPAQHAVLVADMHIGKAATFRRKGLPAPQGTTSETLKNLDIVLAAWPVRRLICLGDFLHARISPISPTITALRNWRARYPDLSSLLVRGNHDAHAGEPPADLRILTVDEPYRLGRLMLRHLPLEESNTTSNTKAKAKPAKNGYALAGHIHPAYVLQSQGGKADRLKLPCFVFQEKQGILPAFGAFTGQHVMHAAPGQEIYVCGADRVWAVQR